MEQDLASSLYTWLHDDEGIAAVVGERIYLLIAPANEDGAIPTPFVTAHICDPCMEPPPPPPPAAPTQPQPGTAGGGGGAGVPPSPGAAITTLTEFFGGPAVDLASFCGSCRRLGRQRAGLPP